MTYNLIPFLPHPELRVTCDIQRHEERLILSYEVSGEVGTVDWPLLNPSAKRAEELWKQTCFEAFIGKPGSEAYWELNFSPSGDWNIYYLDGYRRGLSEELSAPLPALDISPGRLAAEIDLTGFSVPALITEIGVAAVIRHMDGETSYWALLHGRQEPDFHDRDSFVARI